MHEIFNGNAALALTSSEQLNQLLESLPDEVLNQLVMRRVQQSVANLHDRVNVMEGNLEKKIKQTEDVFAEKVNITEEKFEKLAEKLNTNYNKFGTTHCTATQLGKVFQVEISAIKVNKLLEIIKVLRNIPTYENGNYKKNLVPFAQYVDNGLVVKKIFTDDYGHDRESYYYHKERIYNLLNKRLSAPFSHLLLLQSKKEIDNYIDDLYSEFIHGII